MASAGDVGKVNIRETTWRAVQDAWGLPCRHRGKIEAKGAADPWFATSRA